MEATLPNHSKNGNLIAAKKNKQDEFYTQLCDIEAELNHYTKHFKDKVIYCNCDDYRSSNFFKYFFDNFEKLGIRKLITACYIDQDKDFFSQEEPEQALSSEYEGKEIVIKVLRGNGSFKSAESIALLKQADIVITNPPFSLFRQYVAQLIEYDKKFIIIGGLNAITYTGIFKLIKDNLMWVGNTPMWADLLFDVPDDFAQELLKTKKQGSGYQIINGVVKGRAQAFWFTNFDIAKPHKDLMLYKTYYGNEADYPKYDNYDAINIDKTKDIPSDYKGAMGVPISFMDKYSPQQFEIIKFRQGDDGKFLSINGRIPYFRILIKNKKI